MVQGPFRIGVLAFDDCLGAELFGVTDVVATAGHVARQSGRGSSRPVECVVLGRSPRVRLAGGHAVEVTPLGDRAARLDSLDALVVPGFEAATTDALDRRLEACDVEVSAIGEAAARGAAVASVCVGAFLVAAAGLLDDRRATTAWLFAAHLAATRPRVQVDARQMLVRDGPVTTAAAFSAALDLALELVREVRGQAVARTTAKITLTSGSRTSQSPYVDRRLLRTEPLRFSDHARAVIEAQLDEPFSLTALARELSVSPRTLSRRFRAETGQTPLGWAQRARVDRARELLETTDRSLGEVMLAVGYRDPTAFRELFRRHTGLTPAAYRHQFRRPPLPAG